MPPHVSSSRPWRIIVAVGFAAVAFVVVSVLLVVSPGRQVPETPGLAAVTPSSAPASSRPSPVDVLRDASEITREMRLFVYERQGGEPDARADETARVSYSKETMRLYGVRFGTRVTALRDRFRELGVTDGELDRYVERATSPGEIPLACARIEALMRTLQYDVR